MGDVGDYWKELRKKKQEKASNLRLSAEQDFEIASDYANDHNLKLKKYSDKHYQLISNDPDWKWKLNIYPGNKRLYNDPNYRGPYLNITGEFTLFNIVNEAIRAINGKKNKKRR